MRRTQTHAWFAPLAAAAALVLAATSVIEGYTARGAERRAEANDVALVAVASSHFNHVSLTAKPGIIAKALYARDGAWCWVIVNGAPASTHLVLRTASGSRDVGAIGDGSPARVFVADAARPQEIDLVAGTSVIAHARAVY